jgi:hypothetical protein
VYCLISVIIYNNEYSNNSNAYYNPSGVFRGLLLSLPQPQLLPRLRDLPGYIFFYVLHRVLSRKKLQLLVRLMRLRLPQLR